MVMLIVNRLGPGAAAYYRDGPPGLWWGDGIARLDLAGPVDPAGLRAVLRGEDPATNARLPEHVARHRRAGWDLMLAAPKSVSLLAAMDRSDGTLVDAHRQAVSDTLAWFEGHGCWARRSGVAVAAEGTVAARFEHRTSSAGDPHLHTHVVVANLVWAGGKWSALDDRGLWLHRRALAAAYHLGLRHHIREAGLELPWQLSPDGTADVATVPRGAVEAASRRHVAIQAELAEAERRSHDGEVIRRRLRTEQTRAPDLPDPGPDRWTMRVAAAGLATGDAGLVVDAARAAGWSTRAASTARPGEAGSVRAESQPGTERQLVGAVVAHLAARQSTFNVADVMAALAASHAPGTTPTEATRWATALCASALPAPGGRWTTPYAQAIDRRLHQLASSRADRSVTALTPGVADGLIAAAGHGNASIAGAVRTLTTCPDGVMVIGRPADAGRIGREPWIGQAALLEAATQVWQAAGMSVAVRAGSGPAARRWEALTGLDAADPARMPDVLVVDRADRTTTGQLSDIVLAAGRADTTIVLVEGGTLPPRRRDLSEGLEALAADRGRITLTTAEGLAARPPAVDRLITTWWQDRGDRHRPLLVGLGPAECQALNQLARRQLRAVGAITGEEVHLAGRSYATGDQVMILDRLLGSAGTTGRVDAVRRQRGTIEVTWTDGSSRQIDGYLGRHIGHAYATTPAMLRLTDGPLAVLGPADQLGRHAGRVVLSVGAGRIRGGQEPAALAPGVDRGRHRGWELG
jgi:conjugative relaxase-like TrwC/TraI family protein